jgi:hypothetical protein
MPVEGHWERMNVPLRPRDRLVLVVAGGLAVVVTVIAVVFALTRGAAHSGAGCVTVGFASTMGGASMHSCGPAAHRLCRTQGKIDTTVGDACRAQGFAADVQR